MTLNLFDQVQNCVDEINRKFSTTGALGTVYRTDILADKEYSSLKYRRAHISTIKTDKLYLLHVTVFPHTNDPSPIYGFDIVCGPSRRTKSLLPISKAKPKNTCKFNTFRIYRATSSGLYRE